MTQPAGAADQRAAFADGLQILADAIRQHPETPLPQCGSGAGLPWTIGFHGDPEETRTALAATLRALPCTWTQGGDRHWAEFNGQLSGLHVRLYIAREAAFTARVTRMEPVTDWTVTPEIAAALAGDDAPREVTP